MEYMLSLIVLLFIVYGISWFISESKLVGERIENFFITLMIKIDKKKVRYLFVKFVYELTQCIRCTSFHVGGWLFIITKYLLDIPMISIFSNPVLGFFLFGFLSIGFVHYLEKHYDA